MTPGLMLVLYTQAHFSGVTPDLVQNEYNIAITVLLWQVLWLVVLMTSGIFSITLFCIIIILSVLTL